MKIVEGSIRQPVTVFVAVVLVLLAALVAVRRVPVQLTPDVDDTIISVSTTWPGASPEEIEQSIVESKARQEAAEKMEQLSLRNRKGSPAPGAGVAATGGATAGASSAGVSAGALAASGPGDVGPGAGSRADRGPKL